MADIRDYIKWRGDLLFSNSPFNEVDNAILSRFSYFPFDKIIDNNEVATIEELYAKFVKTSVTEHELLQNNDLELFTLLGNSDRFKKLEVMKFVNSIDIEQEKQFAAITIMLPDDVLFISYRGTDNTLIGWKEDFNMSYKSHLPAQLDAVSYLNEVASIYPNKSIMIGGHSKGGNLAMYSAIFCMSSVKDRIVQVYNNDGPGFSKDIVSLAEYKEILPKMISYIPQASVIGRLLEHYEKNIIVESTEKGIMQHSIYSWQVLGTKMVHLEELVNGSKFVDNTITEWLESVEPKQREQFVDTLFEVFNTTDADRLSEMKENWFASVKAMLSKYKSIDNEHKEMINETLQSLFQIAKDNIFKK